VELTSHPLAANNFLFGVSNFFVLPLPPMWELLRGPLDPEVDRQATRDDISWVQEGRAMYLLVHPGYRVTVELQIAIKPGRSPPRMPAPLKGWAHGHLDIGGHRAEYAIGEVSRGWWPRKRVRVLRTAFYCETIGRGIDVEFIAEGTEEAHLHEILQALVQLQCH
jgi:hypothetical protein